MSTLTHGPVDLVLIEFEGEVPAADVARAFTEVMDSDVVRLLDLVVVSRDAAGELDVVELEELHAGEINVTVSVIEPGLVTEDDINELTADLAAGSSAVLFALESVWARNLADLMESAGGVVMTESRIPAHAVSAALAE